MAGCLRVIQIKYLVIVVVVVVVVDTCKYERQFESLTFYNKLSLLIFISIRVLVLDICIPTS